MRIIYFFLLIFSISFPQNKITKSDIIGKWEVKVKVKQLLKEEIKNLDMLEKMAVELASGFAEDIIDSADMYVLFKNNNTALLTVDFLEYEEQEASIQLDMFTAGYFNTTSAIDEIQFKFESGNIDAGTITLYGIN